MSDVPWRQDPALEALPPAVELAFRSVVRELQEPKAVPLIMGYDRLTAIVWIQEESDDATRNGYEVGALEGAELLVDVAAYLQEQVFPDTSGAWGQARPACPGHAHPAIPVLQNGSAWWMCPSRRTLLREMAVAS